MTPLRSLIAVVVLAAIVLVAIPQQAQAAALNTVTPKSVIVTEAPINASYRINNPVRRSVTNAHVALGDGTVTISATLTYRNSKSCEAASVWKPYVKNGVLVFNFQSATVNGQSASAPDAYELRLAHQYIVRDFIRDYVRSQVGGAFKYTGVIVTPCQIEIDVNVYTKSSSAVISE